MQVTCPHCSRTFESELTGSQFCPHCGGQLEVPAAGAVLPVTPTSPTIPAGLAPPVPATGGWGLPPPGSEPPGGSGGRPPDGEGAPPTTPWERRAQLGVLQGFWQTLKQVALSPQTFWPTVNPQGELWDGISFAWIVHAIASLLALPLSFGNQAAMTQMMQTMQTNLPPESQEFLRGVMQHATAGGVGVQLGAVLFYPAFLVMGAGVFHLCALITGAGGQGFGATLRVVAYANAVQIVAFHSCLAFPAFLYQLVLVAMGMRVVHRTTTGKTVFAMVLPLLLCCVCCCVGGMSMGALAKSMNLGH